MPVVPLVQHGDTRVTHVLLHAPLGDEAVTTVDLHAVVGRFEAHFGHECLGDRREEGQQRVGLLLLLFIPAVLTMSTCLAVK